MGGEGEGVGQCLSFKVLGVETRKEVEGICGRVTGFTWVVGDTRSDLSVVEGVDTKYKKKKMKKKVHCSLFFTQKLERKRVENGEQQY